MAQRPLPASVYWRRRLVVLGGLVAVIAVIVLIVVGPGFGTTATEPVEEEDPMAVVEVPNCLPSQLELTARTDQTSYDSGVNPQLWLGVKNISSVECTVQVGADVQRYVISSGPDLIWSSEHCQSDATPYEVTLGPGVEQETGSIQWDRTRSTEDTCDTTRPVMPAGGASYHLTVYLGDLESPETKQFLLY
ncbi:MAG: hypothetical protein RL187_937 [Actinomycetota bacterium]